MPLNSSIGKADLLNLGFDVGAVNDGWFQYLGSLGYTGSLNDRWMKLLGDQGLTGTINDRLNLYNGTAPFSDGLSLESGDRILLESGDFILLEAA